MTRVPTHPQFYPQCKHRPDLVEHFKKMGRTLYDQLGSGFDPRFRSRNIYETCVETQRLLGHNNAVEHKTDSDMVRAAVSSGSMSEVFSAAVGSAILAGYAEAPDSLAGVCLELSLLNFLPASVLSLTPAARLQPLGRGGEAAHVELDADGEDWRLSRYAAQLVADEQDLVDDVLFGAILMASRQMGTAARATKLDLLYSVLLSNETTGDGVALFNTATHGNLGTGALSAPNLCLGLQAIAGHVFLDGEQKPIHVNLAAKYLVVPPALLGTAMQLARLFNTGAPSDLQVRVDSRVSAAGVRDPLSGELHAGSDTAWYLFAPAVNRAAIAVGALDGMMEPDVSTFTFAPGDRPRYFPTADGQPAEQPVDYNVMTMGGGTPGRWGQGWRVKLDLAAKVLDFRCCYKSTGAG
jgi:hypothetical protein